MKNNIKYVLLAIFIGIIIGKYIFNEYKESAISTMSEDETYIYLMQYGVYSNETNLKDNTKQLKNYFYYEDNDGYHVLIGITKNKKLKQKIMDSYSITENIYMKKEKVDNQEFIELLSQYDLLVDQTEEKDIILASEKQVLSKYEELILNSGI